MIIAIMASQEQPLTWGNHRNVHNGLRFRERGMIMISVVYKRNTRDNKVFPSFRPQKEKPYVLLVTCIDDEFTKSPNLAMV
jgi:hypothetical protein